MGGQAARTRDPEHTEQIGTIVLWGTVSVVILVILLAWLRSFFFVIRNETIETVYLSTRNPQLEDLRAHEDSVLTSYGWVDRDRGIVRIPIDRAMELAAQGSAPNMTPSPEAGRP